MGYLYDPLKETFVSDTVATDLEKDVPVRKPNAVPQGAGSARTPQTLKKQ